jgi:nucleotide-binding universal stress UspA family protein
MYKRILVPLDGSTASERILAHIRPFITPRHTRLTLLRVIDPTRDQRALGTIESPSVTMARLKDEAGQYLARVRGELRGLGIPARVEVVDGDVASAIYNCAEADDVDLIAMSTHGRSGVSRWALGSVADHVVRITRQPVLLVRSETEVVRSDTIRKVLVPLDGSRLAEQALEQAVRIAGATGASLLLTRAVNLKTERELDGILEQVEGRRALRAYRSRAADHYLTHIQEQLRARDVASDAAVVQGEPADAILAAAESAEVDLIVMSTHARSGLGRWVYGSIADKVLRGANRPLLLMRPRHLPDSAHLPVESYAAMPVPPNGAH